MRSFVSSRSTARARLLGEVPYEIGRQGREDHVRQHASVRDWAQLGQEQRGVLVPARIRAGEVSTPRASAVGGDQQLGLLDGEVERGVEERDELFAGRSP